MRAEQNGWHDASKKRRAKLSDDSVNKEVESTAFGLDDDTTEIVPLRSR